jgi:hypothetical protein
MARDTAMALREAFVLQARRWWCSGKVKLTLLA